MKKLYLLSLLLLASKIAGAQDFVLKAVSDHFSISQNGQGINIYGNDIKDNQGNYFLKSSGSNSTLSWSNITGTPTTLAGYGITDAANYTASNGIVLTGNNFALGGPPVTGPIGISLQNSDQFGGMQGQFLLRNTYSSNMIGNPYGGTQVLLMDGQQVLLQARDTTNSPITGFTNTGVTVRHSNVYMGSTKILNTGGISSGAGITFKTTGQLGAAIDSSAKGSFSIYASNQHNLYQGILSKFSGTINGITQVYTKGMQVSDNIDNIGFLYGAKTYDGRNFDGWIPTWLAVKTRIDSAITANATYTASNGITKTGNNFTLGGTTTGFTVINTGTNYFQIHDNVLGGVFQLSPGAVLLTGKVSNTGGDLQVNNANSYMDWTNSSGQSNTFRIDNNFTIVDVIGSSGLKEANDYSANYTARNYISKGYADVHYSSATPSWSSITGKPTTLSGYGITDAYPLTGNPSGFITTANLPASANPTASIGLTAVNGSATTYMRSDAAPALSQSITPTWTGVHTYSAGAQFNTYGIALGTIPSTNAGVNIASGLTGSTAAYGVITQPTIQSSVTGAYYGYNSVPATAAASFTLPTLIHYYANQGVIGSGSSVTNQYGFYAQSTMTGAANNYGFFGNIAAGTGRWNLYMAGTAQNYLAGNTGFGVTTPSAKVDIAAGSATVASLHIAAGTNLTTPVSGSIENDGTNLYYTNSSNVRQALLTSSTAIAAANPTASIGLATVNGSATTYMRSDAAPAIAQSITPTWTGLHTFNAGLQASNIGIGTAPTSNIGILVNKTLLGSSGSAHDFLAQGTYDSNTTVGAATFYSVPSTAAASFTLTSSYGFRADGITKGAGSTVTNQYGFFAHSNLTTATNNYGFYGNVPSGTNNYNLYMNGTGMNFLNGNLGIGALPTLGVGLYIGSSVNTGVSLQPTISASSFGYYSRPLTQASSTITSVWHYEADGIGLGSGSTVTNNYGFFVSNNFINGTNNYGFRGLVPAGANNYNLYMDGAAMNYLAGNTGFGVLTPAAKVDVAGTATIAPLHIASGTLLTTPAPGSFENDGTNLYYTNFINNSVVRQPVATVDGVVIVTDANYAVTAAQQFLKLPTPTASRTISMPSASIFTGKQIKIWNQNTSSSFTWSFGTANIQNAAGSTLGTIPNQTIYVLESDGTNWIKIN